MMCSNLYQTVFHIEKLMNAVNVGKGSAYQIFTIPGKQLGQFGRITLPAMRPAANEELHSLLHRIAVTGFCGCLKRNLR